MTLFSATLLLILVMDPLGNVPMFLSVLNPVAGKKYTFREEGGWLKLVIGGEDTVWNGASPT